MSTPTNADTGAVLDLPMLLDVLGYGDDEFVSICHKVGAKGKFKTAVVVPDDAPHLVAELPEGADVWFGVNPVAGPARVNDGRGRAAAVTRLAALLADLDVGPGKCPDFETAYRITDDLTAMLGTAPTVITHSGHGLHLYWRVGDDDTEIELTAIETLLRRFGATVKAIAERHGAKVDSVFDLARILRVPGSLNHKSDPPKPATAIRGGGHALTVAEIDTAIGAFEASGEVGGGGGSGDAPITGCRDYYTPDTLIARVRKAREGKRNQTLYKTVKDAARLGYLEDDGVVDGMKEDLRKAALDAGLTEAEIQDTIASAARSGDQVGGGTEGPSSEPEDGAALLDDLVVWFGRFIAMPDPDDYGLLALWTVSTHMAAELYTTPRLLIDSIMPGSGKTTVLEHLSHLCWHPVQAASVSSPAMLARLVRNGPRTLLLDEIDRTLAPDKPGVGDLLGVLNSGYKRGATRPVSVPDGNGGWTVEEMSTFAPVAMAGNNPSLPDDTRSRSIRILLMPDIDGTVEDSDWEIITEQAQALCDRIIRFADAQRETVAREVELPAGCVSRAREKWKPLKRIAVAAGGDWLDAADALIVRGLDEDAAEREDGLLGMPPGMVLLDDLFNFWPTDVGDDELVPTSKLVVQLTRKHPDYWGPNSAYGKALTSHRFGRIVRQAARVSSLRPGGRGPRGFTKSQFSAVWHRVGIGRTPPDQSGASGYTGASGAAGAGNSAPDAPLQPLAPLAEQGVGDPVRRADITADDTRAANNGEDDQ